ncbi:MAG: group 1 glycosyl transferase [Chloroflexi bacterium OLB13]|nr:MAG: group 1 glycosyl transferase [Chloroflexi bacterium OLB13]
MVDKDIIRYMTRNEADMAFKKRVETVFEWVEPRDDMTILDMPCGRGFYLNMLRYVSKARLVGADLDAEVIEKARRNIGHLPGISLVRANIYDLPFPDGTFDAVILSEVLEHIDDDVGGLKEALRVLKPGAWRSITVPHANYPFWWDPINKTLESVFKTHIQHGPFAGIWANHVRLYTPEQLRSAAIGAGFEVERERAFTHHSFPFIHNLVYGFGKPLLERGALPKAMAQTADRTQFDQPDAPWYNPIRMGLAAFNWFDRGNVLDEPPGRSTVNLALKARKPPTS